MPAEYVVRWSGGRIGSGATVLHFAPTASPTVAQAIATRTRAFFNQLASFLPDDVVLNFDSEVRVITAAGDLEAVLPVTPGAAVAGTSAGSFASGMGAMIRWNTGAVVGGKRIIGKTFLAPLSSTNFTASGSVAGAFRTTVQTEATAFLANLVTDGSRLVVWSRTYAATSDVLTAAVPERPSYLRSRNDRL